MLHNLFTTVTPEWGLQSESAQILKFPTIRARWKKQLQNVPFQPKIAFLLSLCSSKQNCWSEMLISNLLYYYYCIAVYLSSG